METCCECGCDILPNSGGRTWSDGINYPFIVCSDECEEQLGNINGMTGSYF